MCIRPAVNLRDASLEILPACFARSEVLMRIYLYIRMYRLL